MHTLTDIWAEGDVLLGWAGNLLWWHFGGRFGVEGLTMVPSNFAIEVLEVCVRRKCEASLAAALDPIGLAAQPRIYPTSLAIYSSSVFFNLSFLINHKHRQRSGLHSQ